MATPTKSTKSTTPPPAVLREAAAALDAQAAAEESAAPADTTPPAEATPPALPAMAKMLKKPYNHPTFNRTVSFRVGADCWSATGIYLGQDNDTAPGETLMDLADELKAQEAAALASQAKGATAAANGRAKPAAPVSPTPTAPTAG